MLHRLIYVSRPFGFDTAVLGGILVGARRNNARDGLTGALICRADIYLQLLEGSPAAVARTYAGIAADDRHCDVERLVSEPTADRLFPGWEMLDDPARSWLWSAAEVARGAVAAASAAAVVGVFARLATERKVDGHGTTVDRGGDPPTTCPAAALA